MTETQRQVLARTIRVHLLLLPLWVVWIAIDSAPGVVAMLARITLDLVLVTGHISATYVASRRGPADFGEVTSWTRLLYVPPGFALMCLVRDVWVGVLPG